MSGSQAVEWVLLDPSVPNSVEVGDLVSVEAGGMPIYQVVAVDGGQVWLGDERRGAVRAMRLDSFRWRAGLHPAH